MKLLKTVGITSYGTALPNRVVPASVIEQAQAKVGEGIPQSLGVSQKTLPARDEDAATLATAAAAQAVERWSGSREKIGALWVGSESHPYAVKPTGTMVSAALGLGPTLAMADLQFACKAGTQGLQITASYVASEMIEAGLAIGSDTAQARPGDVLEFTAGAGAAAYLVGREGILARLLNTVSVASDTPDFWRRPGQGFPEHAGRFTGEPAYFELVTRATQFLLEETKLKPTSIDWCVFHTPNAKFPQVVAKQLGFTPEQLAPSLIVKKIGNTYAAASMLALAAVLDQATAGQKILVTSYGSGAGSDSFLFETTEELVKQRANWSGLVSQKIKKLKEVDLPTYLQLRDRSH